MGRLMLTRLAKPAIGHDGLRRQGGHRQSCEGDSHDVDALSGIDVCGCVMVEVDGRWNEKCFCRS